MSRAHTSFFPSTSEATTWSSVGLDAPFWSSVVFTSCIAVAASVSSVHDWPTEPPVAKAAVIGWTAVSSDAVAPRLSVAAVATSRSAPPRELSVSVWLSASACSSHSPALKPVVVWTAPSTPPAADIPNAKRQQPADVILSAAGGRPRRAAAVRAARGSTAGAGTGGGGRRGAARAARAGLPYTVAASWVSQPFSPSKARIAFRSDWKSVVRLGPPSMSGSYEACARGDVRRQRRARAEQLELDVGHLEIAAALSAATGSG